VSKEQQIEEYEKLFKVMNGPIENLVAYSRSSHQQKRANTNRA
jgi:hypothetical protein